jgi:hypothetical protein
MKALVHRGPGNEAVEERHKPVMAAAAETFGNATATGALNIIVEDRVTAERLP